CGLWWLSGAVTRCTIRVGLSIPVYEQFIRLVLDPQRVHGDWSHANPHWLGRRASEKCDCCASEEEQ
ncbi:MAG: hypothetical protein VYB72_07880, partial [Planctomycetota bacterium]|nr:hypothetical protein [Planctomycetota bacterium]